MKLTIHPEDLASAVTWTTQNYDAKDSQSYVALTLDRDTGKASLTHVNQSSHTSAPLSISNLEFDESEDEDRYSIPLSGDFLKNLAGVVKRIGVVLQVSKKLNKKNDPLKFKGERQNFTVPVLSMKTRGEPELIRIAEVNDSDLFGSLQRLAKLCTPVAADTGASTGSVSMKLGEEQLKLMATDSYSLGEIVIDYEPDGGSVKSFSDVATNGNTVLIPRAAALTVKGSKSATDTVELVYEEASQKFGYRFDDGRLALFSLDQGTPILYENQKKMAAELSTESLDLRGDELLKAIDSISALSTDEVDVTMTIKGGKKPKVTIADSSGANLISLESVDTDFHGTVEFVFFREVIRKSLGVIYGDVLRFFFTDDDPRLVVLAPLKEDGETDPNNFALAMMSI